MMARGAENANRMMVKHRKTGGLHLSQKRWSDEKTLGSLENRGFPVFASTKRLHYLLN